MEASLGHSLAEVAAWAQKLELEQVTSTINEASRMLDSIDSIESDDLPASRAKGLELCIRVGALEELITSGKPHEAWGPELDKMVAEESRRTRGLDKEPTKFITYVQDVVRLFQAWMKFYYLGSLLQGMAVVGERQQDASITDFGTSIKDSSIHQFVDQLQTSAQQSDHARLPGGNVGTWGTLCNRLMDALQGARCTGLYLMGLLVEMEDYVDSVYSLVHDNNSDQEVVIENSILLEGKLRDVSGELSQLEGLRLAQFTEPLEELRVEIDPNASRYNVEVGADLHAIRVRQVDQMLDGLVGAGNDKHWLDKCIKALPSIGSIDNVKELAQGHADQMWGSWCRDCKALVLQAAHAARYMVGMEWYDKDLERGVRRLASQEVDDKSDEALLTALYTAVDPTKLGLIDSILEKRPTQVDRDAMWSHLALKKWPAFFHRSRNGPSGSCATSADPVADPLISTADLPIRMAHAFLQQQEQAGMFGVDPVGEAGDNDEMHYLVVYDVTAGNSRHRTNRNVTGWASGTVLQLRHAKAITEFNASMASDGMDFTTLRAKACSHLVAQHPQWGPIRLVGEVAYNEQMPDPESYRKFADAVAKGKEAHSWRVANSYPVESKRKYRMNFGGRHTWWLLPMPCGLIVAFAGDNPCSFMRLMGDSTDDEQLAADKAYRVQLFHDGRTPYPYWEYAVGLAEEVSELSATSFRQFWRLRGVSGVGGRCCYLQARDQAGRRRGAPSRMGWSTGMR
jgi:hypothetical protein